MPSMSGAPLSGALDQDAAARREDRDEAALRAAVDEPAGGNGEVACPNRDAVAIDVERAVEGHVPAIEIEDAAIVDLVVRGRRDADRARAGAGAEQGRVTARYDDRPIARAASAIGLYSAGQ